jgi:hypothetical protein
VVGRRKYRETKSTPWSLYRGLRSIDLFIDIWARGVLQVRLFCSPWALFRFPIVFTSVVNVGKLLISA